MRKPVGLLGTDEGVLKRQANDGSWARLDSTMVLK
jgi:hypothetical protein